MTSSIREVTKSPSNFAVSHSIWYLCKFRVNYSLTCSKGIGCELIEMNQELNLKQLQNNECLVLLNC